MLIIPLGDADMYEFIETDELVLLAVVFKFIDPLIANFIR